MIVHFKEDGSVVVHDENRGVIRLTSKTAELLGKILSSK